MSLTMAKTKRIVPKAVHPATAVARVATVRDIGGRGGGVGGRWKKRCQPSVLYPSGAGGEAEENYLYNGSSLSFSIRSVYSCRPPRVRPCFLEVMIADRAGNSLNWKIRFFYV